MNLKHKALNGEHNKKMNSKVNSENISTEALADKEKLIPESNISIPSDKAVEDAKDWVDNGSKL